VNAFQIVALVVGSCMVLAGLTVIFANANRNIDRILLDDLTDDTIRIPKIVDRGRLTDYFPIDDMPTQSSLGLVEHSDMTVEFFPQLTAEEAQR